MGKRLLKVLAALFGAVMLAGCVSLRGPIDDYAEVPEAEWNARCGDLRPYESECVIRVRTLPDGRVEEVYLWVRRY